MFWHSPKFQGYFCYSLFFFTRHTRSRRKDIFKKPKSVMSLSSVFIVVDSLKGGPHVSYLLVLMHSWNALSLTLNGIFELLLTIRQQRWGDVYMTTVHFQPSYQETLSPSSDLKTQTGFLSISIWRGSWGKELRTASDQQPEKKRKKKLSSARSSSLQSQASDDTLALADT